MKRMIAVLLVLCMLVPIAACAETASAKDALFAACDVSFARTLTQTIADMGDNEDVGNRSSGSAAEQQAAALIEKTMREIGLQNVTADPFTTDTWSFNRGRIVMTDLSGAEQTIVLGGYATNLTYNDDVSIVYAGRGTEADYEGLDVYGKVVLIDIDQANEWWISVPTYEAYLRGALCVIACNVSGYATYDADTIGSQDICGLPEAATFAVSQNGSKALQEVIAANGGEATVKLDVDSVVTQDGQSLNVWGEIPGKTDEVIYYFAHYDGYYHSFFDDACCVGSMLAIAKAMVETGYTPDKTIRFVAHGAEEWGKSGTEYDWSQGAFKEITEVHPEWAETAFAVLNIDGMYPVKGHTYYTVAAAYELADFINANDNGIYADGAYEFEVTAPTGCWTEDFGYLRAGVPTVVANEAGPEELYHATAYHSSMDNVVLGVDEEAWLRQIKLFAGYGYALDQLAARPMNFAARFEAMQEVYAGEADLGIEALTNAANAVTAKIEKLNADYAAALANGDNVAAEALRKEGIALDTAMYKTFDYVTDYTLAFDWDDNVIFPFELTDWNIEGLAAAIGALELLDAETALDALTGVDYNWYGYEFSEMNYEYQLTRMWDNAVGTWGEGMIRYRGENLWTVMHSLMAKVEAGELDYTDEIEALSEALVRQMEHAAEIEADLVSNIATTTTMLQEIAA